MIIYLMKINIYLHSSDIQSCKNFWDDISFMIKKNKWGDSKVGKEKKKKFKTNKKKKISWISGVRISIKRLILAVVIMLPLVYIVAELRTMSDEIQNERKVEMEKTMITVTEQYANVAVENMVDIAKTITQNDKVYDLINTYYKTSKEYSEAYQKFRDSRTLAIADSNAVRSLEIYTENPSVMNGGMMKQITAGVKESEWYYDLELSGKNTILYCDRTTGSLSLIRRLDMKPLDYGESLIKLDFSMPYFRSVFKNILFNGKIFISCNHSLLYSNDDKANYNSIYNFGSGVLRVSTGNFYSCPMDFYVYADCENTFNRMIRDPVNITCAALVFLAAVIAFYVSVDMRKRIGMLNDICSGSLEADNMDFGKDEIGKLYSSVYELIAAKNKCIKENEYIKNLVSDDSQKLLKVEREVYNYDAKLTYLKLVNEEKSSSLPEVESLISFSKEFRKLSRYIEYLNSVNSGNFELTIDTSGAEPDDMYILPYSLVLMTAGLIKIIKRSDIEIMMSIVHHGPEICLSLKIPGFVPEKNSLKKLINVCTASEGDIPEFRKGNIYNSIIRIRKYYNDDVRFIVNAGNDTELKMMFRAPKLFRQHLD